VLKDVIDSHTWMTGNFVTFNLVIITTGAGLSSNHGMTVNGLVHELVGTIGGDLDNVVIRAYGVGVDIGISFEPVFKQMFPDSCQQAYGPDPQPIIMQHIVFPVIGVSVRSNGPRIRVLSSDGDFVQELKYSTCLFMSDTVVMIFSTRASTIDGFKLTITTDEGRYVEVDVPSSLNHASGHLLDAVAEWYLTSVCQAKVIGLLSPLSKHPALYANNFNVKHLAPMIEAIRVFLVQRLAVIGIVIGSKWHGYSMNCINRSMSELMTTLLSAARQNHTSNVQSQGPRLWWHRIEMMEDNIGSQLNAIRHGGSDRVSGEKHMASDAIQMQSDKNELKSYNDEFGDFTWAAFNAMNMRNYYRRSCGINDKCQICFRFTTTTTLDCCMQGVMCLDCVEFVPSCPFCHVG
jgi:hypothetical protein